MILILWLGWVNVHDQQTFNLNPWSILLKYDLWCEFSYKRAGHIYWNDVQVFTSPLILYVNLVVWLGLNLHHWFICFALMNFYTICELGSLIRVESSPLIYLLRFDEFIIRQLIYIYLYFACEDDHSQVHETISTPSCLVQLILVSYRWHSCAFTLQMTMYWYE